MKWVLAFGVLVVTVAALSTGAGAGTGAQLPKLQRALDDLDSAMRYEAAAERDAAEGHFSPLYGLAPLGGDGRSFTAINSLDFARGYVETAQKDGEIDDVSTAAIEGHIADAIAFDRKAERAGHRHDAASVKVWLAHAKAEKRAALKRIEHLLAAKPAAGACTGSDGYDPNFPDYAQEQETCKKAVVGLSFTASVPVTAAGWLGVVIINCPVSGMTATCTGISNLPAQSSGKVYIAHQGGFPHGDVASVTITFADGTKQTQSFANH